jgi:hypothetical protein
MGEQEKKAIEPGVKAIPPDSERRKFVKASLAIAPVVLTIASKSVLGQTKLATPSAGSANSGNQTNQP